MLQQALDTNIRRFMNFLGFARGYLARNNLLESMFFAISVTIKDFLTMHKKRKMSQYRLNYHMHQLYKMESLIAENNEHSFIKGRNINEVR